jgi:metacaspase-1
MARGISVHVGVNSVDPAHYNGWDGTLNACEFDAHDMVALAESRRFEPSTLLTKAATADAVKEAIGRAAAELTEGDFFFITYSGHGGQVPDRNDEDEEDRSDETWALYDRQLVDDELYALWATFRRGVRIVLLSDSCHSGSVARNIEADVPDVVARAETADAVSPRYRAVPRDVMVATYRANAPAYDEIQTALPTSERAEIGATVLLISGCQDDQLSRDGVSNGLSTENLLAVWDKGAWTGSYPRFHETIVSRMPESQTPNYLQVGPPNPDFEQQDPLTIS